MREWFRNADTVDRVYAFLIAPILLAMVVMGLVCGS